MKTKSIIRSSIVALLLLLAAQPMAGQESFKPDPKTTTFIDNAAIECIYKYTINAPLKDSLNKKMEETHLTLLQMNGSVSKFWDWHAYIRDSIMFTCSPDQVITAHKKRLSQKHLPTNSIYVPVVLKNYPNGEITNQDEIYPADYIYTESKTNRNWKLKDDTLTVCGYLCYKAVTSFGGREWTAWYAPEITLSDGPWKLYGLPGLILKAQDSTGTHTFEAIGLKKSNDPIYATTNAFQIRITKDVFFRNKTKSEKNPAIEVHPSQLRTYSVENGDGGEKKVTINGKRNPMNRKTVYCPLELEK